MDAKNRSLQLLGLNRRHKCVSKDSTVRPLWVAVQGPNRPTPYTYKDSTVTSFLDYLRFHRILLKFLGNGKGKGIHVTGPGGP
jgi:hypothetical protein